MPATPTEFTTADARAIFESAINRPGASVEQSDNARLLCEYFCNPAFRKAMQDAVARINGA